MTNLRFFYFSYIVFFGEGSPVWGNIFVKCKTFPALESVDAQIKAGIKSEVKQVLILNWTELSHRDYISATGTPEEKVQPVSKPLIKSLK